jgi:hypothetical protein
VKVPPVSNASLAIFFLEAIAAQDLMRAIC